MSEGQTLDHAVIGTRIVIGAKEKRVKRVDWKAVSEYVEHDEEHAEEEWIGVGEAYQASAKLTEERFMREIRIVGQSKPWWKAEWKGLRKRVRRSREVRRQLRGEIREAKRKMWNDWVEEGREVWDIIRVCKNPFGRRERCGTIRDEGGIYETEGEKLEAFVRHNLILTEPAEPKPPVQLQARKPIDREMRRRVETALGRTKNNSAPGPDRVS